MKRYRQKMNQVALQFAQMIQNVSQTRDNKKITKADLENAARVAYLTIFPGVTGVPTTNNHMPLGYFIECFIHYIVGVSNGKACLKWRWQCYYRGNPPNHDVMINRKPEYFVTLVGGWDGTPTAPSEIFKDLNIKEGETKIIVECQLRHYPKLVYFSDGRSCKQVSLRETFGFWALSPRYDLVDDENSGALFIGTVVFTPKPGLFSETPPE